MIDENLTSQKGLIYIKSKQELDLFIFKKEVICLIGSKEELLEG